MNTGLPIFVDWKHPPFRYDEIINWNKRMKIAKSFFNTDNYEEKKIILDQINNIDKISHILVEKKNFNINCQSLIKDNKYALISVNDCFN